MRSVIILFLLTHFSVLLPAQQLFAPGERRQIKAKAIERDMVIDGVLSEKEWRAVAPATDFTQVEPQQGSSSTVKTDVRLLYNAHNLVVGVVCYEPQGVSGLRAPDLKRDFAWRAHDTFAMCFDGFNDERNSMAFAVNPYEAQKDYLSFDDTFFDGDWNGLWKVRTTRTDSAWIAEIEIPWKTFRYPKNVASLQTWGINFLRLRRYSNEISGWSPYPRSFGFNRMEYAGKLVDLQLPAPSANVQVNPYALVSYQRNAQQKTTPEVKWGGEVKWAINANNILDVTANTDFAQADADVRVNNISRFSVFFPERRSFFLENASLFGSGLMPNENMGGRMIFLPFFSRTIGLSNGNPLVLDGGVRWVHRSLKENYGVMAMRQRGNEENPLTHFGVARYSRNVGKQNRLGGLLTVKQTDANTNNLAGIDGFFRFGKAHSVTGMMLRSQTANFAGWGGYAQYLYTTNTIQAWWTQTWATAQFKPEMGFVSRQDVIATTPGLFTNLRGAWVPWKKVIRAYKPGVTAEWYHTASTGQWVEREMKLFPLWLDFQSGAFLGYSLSYTDQNLLHQFEPLGVAIQPGVYQYQRQSIFAGTDASRKISATVQQEWGHYFDRRLATTDIAVGVAPWPYVSVRLGVNRNYFSGVNTENVNHEIMLYTSEVRLAWSPRLQLIGLYQHNTQNKLDAYNIRLAWEYKPLSYVYVVFNNRSFAGTAGNVQEQTGIFKVSYLKQF